jgi:hypothetical protein
MTMLSAAEDQLLMPFTFSILPVTFYLCHNASERDRDLSRQQRLTAKKVAERQLGKNTEIFVVQGHDAHGVATTVRSPGVAVGLEKHLGNIP